MELARVRAGPGNAFSSGLINAVNTFVFVGLVVSYAWYLIKDDV